MTPSAEPGGRQLRRDLRRLLVLRNRGWVRWGGWLSTLGVLTAAAAAIGIVQIRGDLIPEPMAAYWSLGLVGGAGALAAAGGMLVVNAGHALAELLVREPELGLQRPIGRVLMGAGLATAPVPLVVIELLVARTPSVLEAVLSTICVQFPLLPIGVGLFLDVLRGWALVRQREARAG